jgi:hypothetical protein
MKVFLDNVSKDVQSIEQKEVNGIRIVMWQDADKFFHFNEELSGIWITLDSDPKTGWAQIQECVSEDTIGEWAHRILSAMSRERLNPEGTLPGYETWLRGREKIYMNFMDEKDDVNPWIEDAKVRWEESINDPELAKAYEEADLDFAQVQLGLSGQHPQTIDKLLKVWRNYKREVGRKEYEAEAAKQEEAANKKKTAIESPTGNKVTITLTLDEGIKEYVLEHLKEYKTKASEGVLIEKIE